MVNFRQTPKPRNYLARGEQLRLLLLVMTLGLVVVLMIEARKPQRWYWLTGGEEDDSPRGSASTPEEPIDTRWERPASEDEIPGTFRSPAPAADQAAEASSGRYFPGVNPIYLQRVRDDTPSRPEERKAWFNLLGILQETDEQTLRLSSTGRVTFAQLFKQSKEYRGELVTIRGTVRRAHQVPARDNQQGIKKCYQLWVWPDDNPSSPMVVYCLYLPHGFPTGMTVRAKVEISGFYFKRWVYNAVDSLRRAPTLAARTVRWRKLPPPAKQPPAGLGTLLAAIGVAAAASLGITWYVYSRTRPVRPDTPDEPPRLDILREAEYPSDPRPLPEKPGDQEPPE